MHRTLHTLACFALGLAAMTGVVSPLWAQDGVIVGDREKDEYVVGHTTFKSKVFDVEPPSVPMEQWLKEGPRTDFPWIVEPISKPEVVIQDTRFLLSFNARIAARDLAVSGTQRDLYFFLKMTDGNGNWLDDSDYTALPATFSDKNLAANEPRSFVNIPMYALAKSGTYDVAFIAYDRAHNQRNLWRTSIVVKYDALLTPKQEGLPPVQFLTLHDLVKRSAQLRIDNPRSIHLDVVALAPYHDRGVWQSTVALSKLLIRKGCVHTWAIVTDKKVGELKYVDFTKTDWSRETNRIFDMNDREKQMIDAHDLQTTEERSAAAVTFIRDTVARTLADGGDCSVGAEPAEHVVVVLNTSLDVPGNILPKPLKPQDRIGTKLFYFRYKRSFAKAEAFFRPWVEDDKLGKLLHPDKTFSFTSPRDFHKSIDDLLVAIQAER